MKTVLLFFIIVCVLTLILVLIHSIMKQSINLPEIIIGVIAAIISVLVLFLFNGETTENKENTLNISSTDSAIITTIDNDKIASTENINEFTTECTTEQNSTTSTESFNDKQTPQDTTSTVQMTTAETIVAQPEIPLEPQPVPIKSLILKNASAHYNLSQTEFDPRGKMYTNVIYLYSSATNGMGFNGKLEVYTERKYSTFSCTLVPQADYSTNSGAGAYIEIYEDDVLTYTSDLITYKTTAIDVNLDIRNVEYLKIKIINMNKNYPYMANADTLLCNAFVME